VFKISEASVKEIPENYKYRKHKILIEGAEAVCFVRLLTCIEEFEIFEDFLQRGINRDSLFNGKKNIYDYGQARLIRGLTFEDPKYISIDKIKYLKSKDVSFNTISELYEDSNNLSDFGFDLSPRDVKCTGCGGVSTLAVPFRSGFLV
jgi:hypothetical protein